MDSTLRRTKNLVWSAFDRRLPINHTLHYSNRELGPRALTIAAALIAALAASPVRAALPGDITAEPARTTRPQKLSLAPVKSGAVSGHSPYDVGDCSLCHKRKNPKDPGPVTIAGNKGCFVCHEDFQELLTSRRFKHSVAEANCTNCHNPHNSMQKKLLLASQPSLCIDCHKTTELLMNLKFKHGAMTQGEGCMNCHNPHASNVEHLLTRLPFEQCVQCHDKDNVTDPQGVKLTNMKKLLEKNPVHHGPVAAKDCSACHQPHGADVFRLLSASYPSTFYAPFDLKNYELCFGCHDSTLVTTEKTTTATHFRDGDRNLHFLHVNKADRGRTCRACHEVHASQKVYQIRESVPFGSNGYLLKVSYEKRPDGGACTQTCHTARTYTNAAPVQAKAK
jgi:predicted CXXCH cytochrome family protein